MLQCKCKCFLQERARNDDTWRFLVQFIVRDALVYIALYIIIHAWWKLGIKNGQHEINGTSIYQIYESKTDLNPHLSDLVTLPATIEIMLKLGGAKGRHVVK